jgi:glycosyltransferase involved in cell wall biosynthesis
MVSATEELAHGRTNGFEKVTARQATREIRVLQVFDSLAMGGAETWLMALLKYLHESADDLPVRVRTDILLTGGERSIFDDEAERLGARLFYSRFTRRNFLTFVRKFRRILAEGRYDAIHDHQDYVAGLHFLAGLGRLPKVRVAHVHNTLYSLARYRSTAARRMIFDAAKKLLARTATHVTSTSREMLTEFGFDEPQFKLVPRQVVHCGFDASCFQGDRRAFHREVSEEFGWHDGVKIILFVGRLNEPVGDGKHRKNPKFALEVARGCINQDPQVRMIMSGSGLDMKNELEAGVKSWGLADKVRLTGMYPDITRLMLGSDLFLFPSLAEGLGMVVVEAQAAGLRVLTSTGVPREAMVITDSVEFKALDEGIGAWAQKALQMLSEEPLNAIVCNEAVRRSAFSIENSARHLLRIYSA